MNISLPDRKITILPYFCTNVGTVLKNGVTALRCTLIKFDANGNLLTWVKPETLLPQEHGFYAPDMLMKNETILDNAVLPTTTGIGYNMLYINNIDLKRKFGFCNLGW